MRVGHEDPRVVVQRPSYRKGASACKLPRPVIQQWQRRWMSSTCRIECFATHGRQEKRSSSDKTQTSYEHDAVLQEMRFALPELWIHPFHCKHMGKIVIVLRWAKPFSIEIG